MEPKWTNCFHNELSYENWYREWNFGHIKSFTVDFSSRMVTLQVWYFHKIQGGRKKIRIVLDELLNFLLLSSALTRNPLTCKIWWAPNKGSKWQMGFNSVFKVLKYFSVVMSVLFAFFIDEQTGRFGQLPFVQSQTMCTLTFKTYSTSVDNTASKLIIRDSQDLAVDSHFRHLWL